MDLALGTPTEDAALRARDRVGAAAAAATGTTLSERHAAALARSALFEEALLAAVRARLAELKAAAR